MGVVTNSYQRPRASVCANLLRGDQMLHALRQSRRQAALRTRVSLVCIWSDVPNCGALAFWSPEFHGWAESTSGLVV